MAERKQYVVTDPRREAYEQHLERIFGKPRKQPVTRRTLIKRILGR